MGSDSERDATAESDNWEAAGFIVASEYREDVLARLAEGPATPKTISNDTEYAMAHVSRSLGKLRRKGLVELLVPEETKKGRIYAITDGGEEALELAALV